MIGYDVYNYAFTWKGKTIEYIFPPRGAIKGGDLKFTLSRFTSFTFHINIWYSNVIFLSSQERKLTNQAYISVIKKVEKYYFYETRKQSNGSLF